MKYTNSFVVRAATACAALQLLLSLPAAAALIAEWNFDTGTSADLTSSVGGYTLGRIPAGIGNPGYGNDPVQNPGTISLDQFTELVSTGINSTALPGLTSNGTIYARMRFDGPFTLTGFFFGLVDATQAADFPEMALTAFEFDTTNRSVAGFGHTATPSEIFAGTGTLPAVGEFFDIALVVTAGVNALGDPSPGDTQIRLNINGVDVAAQAGAGTVLQAFQALALGQLKASGGVAPMTFDSVKVFDTSLTAAEIAVIPEPTSLMSLLVGGAIFSATARHRRRG
jgi:hypothetical protein